MSWPTWKQAATLAVACLVLVWLLRRRRPDTTDGVPTRPARVAAAAIPAALEVALVSTLYALWRIARTLPLDQPAGAIERARDLVRVQDWLHLPTELSLQQFVLRHDLLARATNVYYAVPHVPSLLIFLVWMFARHRDAYPRWRNALAITTGFCLIIRFIRVAPPRFLGDLGYVDLATRYGLSLYGPVGKGVSDQFAAMPSIHVAWAAIVSFGTFAATRSRWRWLVLMHVVMTMLVVSATGNHWWLDGVVAIVLLGVALVIDRAWFSPRRDRRHQLCQQASAVDHGVNKHELVVGVGSTTDRTEPVEGRHTDSGSEIAVATTTDGDTVHGR
jgi:membrane protein implicated in regulation of membrane protease activity